MGKYKLKYKSAKNEIKSLKLQLENLKNKKSLVSAGTRRHKHKVLHDKLLAFNPTEEDVDRCEELFSKALNCTDLMGKHSYSIASVVIYLGVYGVTKTKVIQKCSVSYTTLSKLEKIFRLNNLL
jgi:hypothetical protein